MVFRMTNLPLEETPSLLPISAFSPPTPLSRCKNINACFDLTIVPWAWWTKTCSICTTVQKAGTSTNQSCRQLAWWTSATTRTPRLGRPRWSSWSPTMRRSKSSWLDIQLKGNLDCRWTEKDARASELSTNPRPLELLPTWLHSMLCCVHKDVFFAIDESSCIKHQTKKG